MKILPLTAHLNRCAAPLAFDLIKDRDKNAHLAVFGPTGSGKFLTNALDAINTAPGDPQIGLPHGANARLD